MERERFETDIPGASPDPTLSSWVTPGKSSKFSEQLRKATFPRLIIKSDNVHKVPVTLVCGKCSVNLHFLKSQAGIAQAGKDSRIISARTP